MKLEIEITQNEYDLLKQYSTLFDSERRIDCTSDPIVIVEDIEEVITQSGYEDKGIYVWDESTYETKQDLVEALIECEFSALEIDEILDGLYDFGEAEDYGIRLTPVKVLYKPIAYFLTRKEAEDYCEYQSHNLKKPRVYTRNMGYSNRGDLKLLVEMLKRIGDNL